MRRAARDMARKRKRLFRPPPEYMYVPRELPGLEQGPMLPASVGHTLRWMAGAGR
jgi:hypothetical protein